MSFRRSLGPLDATMLVAGSMIGSGIFIVSAGIAGMVQTPGLLLGVWVLTGFLTLIAALSYGELAGMMPEAGGQYVYLREAFGPLAGFLYGWTLFTVIQTGTIAAVAMAFAKFTAVLIPGLAESHILFHLGPVSVSAAQIVAIASIIVLTALNARGVKLGKIVQNIFTSTKLVAVIGLAVVGIAIGVGSEAWTSNMSAFWNAPVLGADGPSSILAVIAVAMVGTIFSSDAWNNITFVASEVQNPKRTIPLSLFWGVLIVTGLYLLVNVAYLSLLPILGSPEGADVMSRGIQYAVNDRVGTAAAEVMFGTNGAFIMAILIMVSTFGCNNGLILSGARAYYAMAVDGLFFAKARTLNGNDVPATALWIQCLWAGVLCLSGQYGNLLDYVVMAVLLFYILTIVGIFRLRRLRPDAERPYKAIGYPVLPALYVVLASAICVCLLIYKPGYTWPGVGLVALGLPVYFIWTKGKGRTA